MSFGMQQTSLFRAMADSVRRSMPAGATENEGLRPEERERYALVAAAEARRRAERQRQREEENGEHWRTWMR